MLTSAQQKVKQELDELHANGLFHHNLGTVPPRNKYSMKKWLYSIIGIILLCSFFLFTFSTSNHVEIVSYLMKEQSYNEQSAKLLIDILEKNNLNLQQAKTTQALLLSQEVDVKAPSSFKDHHLDLTDVLEQRLAILTYLATVKRIDPVRLHKYLIELDVKQELANDSLLKAFDRENITYVLQEDGTVQYWVKSKSYQYNK
jgi:hypothetical protein